MPDMALEGALAQPLGEDPDADPDVNHQVGRSQLSVEQAVDAFVEYQFVGVDIKAVRQVR